MLVQKKRINYIIEDMVKYYTHTAVWLHDSRDAAGRHRYNI